jgi:putative membrane protein
MRYPLALLIAGAILLAISAWDPYDIGTWALEVFPIFIAVPILFATYRRFPLTNLVYTLISSTPAF